MNNIIMRLISPLISILLIFGFLGGGTYFVFGGNLGGVALLEGLNIPKVRVLPTSSLYFLKEWERKISAAFSFGFPGKVESRLEVLDERLDEGANLMLRTGVFSPAVGEFLDSYEEGWVFVGEQLGGADVNSGREGFGGFVSGLVEEGFYHYRFFVRAGEVFPELTDRFSVSRGLIVNTVASGLDLFGEGGIVLGDNIFLDDLLLGLSFIEEVRGAVQVPILGERVVEWQGKIVSVVDDLFVSGEFSESSLAEFFEGDFGSLYFKILLLDILRSGVSDGDFRNYLGILRQDIVDYSLIDVALEGNVVFLNLERVQVLVDSLDGNFSEDDEDARDILEKARFNLDRALEFNEAAVYGRALSQIALAESALRPLLYVGE